MSTTYNQLLTSNTPILYEPDSDNTYKISDGTGSGDIDVIIKLDTTPTPSPTHRTEDIVNQSIDPCPEGTESVICQTKQLEIGTVVGQIVQFVFIIAILLTFGFLVYGGIKWLTSGGDKEGVANARGTIISAIIGLGIIFLSFVILNFIVTFLTGTDLANLNISSLTKPPGS